MPLGEKGEQYFYMHFSCISQEIWTGENTIINKLCGVEMVCICVYTPDDDPFKDTHCVLGLDDNGKVGACEWNHLQRVDQFLISSECYEKKQFNIQNSVTKPHSSLNFNTFLSCLNSGNSRTVSPLWPFNFQSSRAKT